MQPISKNATMETNEKSVVKVFSVKWRGHHYYVQEMPGLWGLGRDFAVMKDRERWCYDRFKTQREAVEWCLAALCRELNQLEIDQFVKNTGVTSPGVLSELTNNQDKK